MSFCLDRNPRSVSISVFFSPASSPISRIQYPCSFSAAVLSFVSLRSRESLNHSPHSLEISVDFPLPYGPFSTSIVSNLQPGSITLAMAPHKVFLVTART